MTRCVRGIWELYGKDPEAADWKLWGRRCLDYLVVHYAPKRPRFRRAPVDRSLLPPAASSPGAPRIEVTCMSLEFGAEGFGLSTPPARGENRRTCHE